MLQKIPFCKKNIDLDSGSIQSISISSFLSSCHEKATEALTTGRILIRLGAALFPSFRLSFASDFFDLLLVRFHRIEIINV